MASKAFIEIGIPGSGKSTYAQKKFEKDPSTCIINPDSIRGQLYGYGNPGVKFDPAMEERTWGMAKHRAGECVEARSTIFIDATNPDRFGRANIIEWFNDTGYEINALRFVIEPGLAILRNDVRGKQDVPARIICEKYLAIREPAPSEGISKVKYIGMPPTADEIAAMKANPDAYDCKKILASP